MKQIFVVFTVDQWKQVTILAAYEKREQAELLMKHNPLAQMEVTYLHLVLK